MQDERFKVKYITVNTCFVYLPEYWLRKLSSRPNAVKVQHNDVNYYLSWYTRPSPDNSALCLSATFARTLNIKEADEVFVSCVEEPPPLTSIAVTPKSSHDREIVELQSEIIQTNLLDQITVVAKNQTIVAWVSKFLSVTLIVKSLNPAFKYGKLEELTEIHVGDTDETSTSELAKINKSESPNDIVSRILNDLPPHQPIISRTYRAHPLPISRSITFVPKNVIEETFRLPFRVYASRSMLPSGENSSTRLYRISKIKEDALKFGKRMDRSREFVVLVCPLEDYIDILIKEIDKNHFTTFSRHPCVYMTEDLMQDLRIKVGEKISLESINECERNLTECTSIEIYPSEKFISDEIFRNYVSRNSRYDKMLLSSHGTVSFEDETHCLIKLLPDNCTYSFFNQATIRNIKIVVSDVMNIEDLRPADEPLIDDMDVPWIKSVAIEVLQAMIMECKKILTLSLGLHNFVNFTYDRENILISGTLGSGKTTICKLLREILSEPPYFAHTRFIDCRSLKGKKVELMQKLLTTEVSFAVYNQPSILFFDDIENITSASSNNDESTPDSINAARITDVILKIIRENQAANYISVVATCVDISKVGKRLREARGVHFFGTMLTIPNLEKDERIKILRSSLQDKLYLTKEIDWDYYGNKTEGWVAQDLVVLADKAAFTAWKRHVKEKREGLLMLRESDFSETLSRCTPMSLHGVNLYKGVGHSWSDIGGLASVKLALVEILYWPLKYPEIFKTAPIKLQSGILLYGMPGTGKTMLAGAIAKECGLNLISVKGPELLSKYIGASEESVRNVFEKAQRAKPCVLFFDEFDSLAPRRGHDSTGVTDRVVNQLLTHLDGIEDREGIAVVAASSRPDLLDPALLRPGRLDKSLLCPLPDENEREEILNALCRSHNINTQNLDLKIIANLTTGFTGADLNAVLMQAKLNLIEETLDQSCNIIEEQQQSNIDRAITQNHLLESVKSTNPSLLAMEKEKYNRIYAKFAKSESYPVDMNNQKATLA